MHVQFPEDLSRIQQMLVLKYPKVPMSVAIGDVSKGEMDALLRVERQKGQVQYDCEPVSVNNKQESQECVNGGFGNDVGVEAVAQVNWVDIIAIFEQGSQHRFHNTPLKSYSSQ